MQRTRPGASRAQPAEDVFVLGVHAELQAAAGIGKRMIRRPRILARRVEACAGQIQTVAAAVLGDGLRLEPGQDAQGLRVALEPADVLRPVVERALAVVAERRVSEVVAEARGVDDVGREPQRGGELTADLRDLQRVREAVAREIRRTGRAQHLGLGGESAQRRGVEHASTIPREVVALRSMMLALETRGIRRRRSLRGARRRRVRRRQPPLWSSSASARAQEASTPSSRDSSQPLGSAGRLGVPARPRWPSAAAPG